MFLKKIHIVCLLLMLAKAGSAGEPASMELFFPSATTSFPHLNTNGIFTYSFKSSSKRLPSYAFSVQTVNKGYVTGHVKEEKSKAASLLQWDLKVKWKLSRNMNIILSYN